MLFFRSRAIAHLIAATAIVILWGCTNRDSGVASGTPSNGAETEQQEAVFVSDSNEPTSPFTFALEKMRGTLPEEISSAIRADPDGFARACDAMLAEPQELTWRVDKTHPLPSDYEPEDLVLLRDVSDLVINREDLRLRQIAIPSLVKMSNAAAADGIVLDISSTYRSYSYQAALFQRNVEQLGLEQAERESARPGTSQHQLGTTIDFGSITPEFAETRAGRWLAENGWQYGFSLSYPDGFESITGYMYEGWHFRYIGEAAAKLEKYYFGGVQQWMIEFVEVVQ